ncbi:molybdenum cofactor guanylyltransferase [Planctomicrobium sp. SH664]|uniref:molybdenum cofactor guanylyltransferase n=1 Tax=Planctomicrobium sp. SH664 TaxID=3448125 RepID=UPI003F5C1EC2
MIDSVGGIVLCGGRSSRMGTPKHLLAFGAETAVARVARIVGGAVSPVVVVAATDQQLPQLPAGVLVARDPETHQGPLAGLLTGLQALPSGLEAIYLTSADMPLQTARFIRGVASRLRGDVEVVVPHDGTFPAPLAAVYRTSLCDEIQSLLDRGERSLRSLLATCRVSLLPAAQLDVIDPGLHSLRNMNTPDDYAGLLQSFEARGE